MKMFLISDNVDTLEGMRLAGIKGIVVHEADAFEAALNAALANKDNAIVLVTEKLFNLMEDYIMDRKLKATMPLIVKIPDRHGRMDEDAMMGYISEAMGIKF